MGLPEPPEEQPEIYSSNETQATQATTTGGSDSDSEEVLARNVYEGYEPLPFDTNTLDEIVIASDGSDDDHGDEDEESDNDREEETIEFASTSGMAEDSIVQEVWSQSASKDIEMNSEKVNAVKEAMQNFTLPACNIPDWAKTIPEQEWTEHVLNKILKK